MTISAMGLRLMFLIKLELNLIEIIRGEKGKGHFYKVMGVLVKVKGALFLCKMGFFYKVKGAHFGYLKK